MRLNCINFAHSRGAGVTFFRVAASLILVYPRFVHTALIPLWLPPLALVALVALCAFLYNLIVKPPTLELTRIDRRKNLGAELREAQTFEFVNVGRPHLPARQPEHDSRDDRVSCEQRPAYTQARVDHVRVPVS